MNDNAPALPFVSKNGIRGTFKIAPGLLGDDSQREVRFETGRQATVGKEHLLLKQDGSYFLDLNVDPRPPDAVPVSASPVKNVVKDFASDSDAYVEDVDAVIPIVEEQLTVTKRVRETGRVRVSKTVVNSPQEFDASIIYEEYSVERVAIGREVTSTETTRMEGDVTIIPVYEEEVVVTKRLVLREEIRLTKRRREEHRPGTMQLRKQEVNIERTPQN